MVIFNENNQQPAEVSSHMLILASSPSDPEMWLERGLSLRKCLFSLQGQETIRQQCLCSVLIQDLAEINPFLGLWEEVPGPSAQLPLCLLCRGCDVTITTWVVICGQLGGSVLRPRDAEDCRESPSPRPLRAFEIICMKGFVLLWEGLIHGWIQNVSQVP